MAGGREGREGEHVVLIIGYGGCVFSLFCAVVSYLLLEVNRKHDRKEQADSGDDHTGDGPAERFFVYASLSFGGMSFLWFIACVGGFIS